MIDTGLANFADQFVKVFRLAKGGEVLVGLQAVDQRGIGKVSQLAGLVEVEDGVFGQLVTLPLARISS